MLRDVRQYIDWLHIEGHSVGEDHDDDPILLDPDGRAVDTWRENYPYDERMSREEYDEIKALGARVMQRMAGDADLGELGDEIVEQQARKRVGIVVEPVKVASWDHRKQG